MSASDTRYLEYLERISKRFGTNIGFISEQVSQASNISQNQNNLIIEFLINISLTLERV